MTIFYMLNILLLLKLNIHLNLYQNLYQHLFQHYYQNFLYDIFLLLIYARRVHYYTRVACYGIG
jgi:hypothetical protein